MAYLKGIIETNGESKDVSILSGSDNARWWYGQILQHITMDTDDLPFNVRTATRIRGTGREGRVNPVQIFYVDIIGPGDAVQKTKNSIDQAIQELNNFFVAPPPILPIEWHDIINDNPLSTELTRYGSND